MVRTPWLRCGPIKAQGNGTESLPPRIQEKLRELGWKIRLDTATMFYLDDSDPTRRVAVIVATDGSWKSVAQKDWSDALWADWVERCKT